MSPLYPLTTLTAIALGHFTTVYFGWYATEIWADRVLHILGGVFFVYGFLWLINTQKGGIWSGNPSRAFIAITAISLSLSGSFAWEMWEYSMWHIIPHLVEYSPNMADAFSDVAFGVLGAIAAVSYYLYHLSKKK
jgi:hypothetical protein